MLTRSETDGSERCLPLFGLKSRLTQHDWLGIAALVVVSALRCGPDIPRLTTLTGLARPFIAAIRQRMIEANLWTDMDVRSDYWAPAPGLFDSTAFWLDVLIAEGLVVRRWDEEQGDYLYCHVDYAPEKQSLRVH